MGVGGIFNQRLRVYYMKEVEFDQMFLVGDIGEILSKRILKSRGEDANNIKYNNVIALRLFLFNKSAP